MYTSMYHVRIPLCICIYVYCTIVLLYTYIGVVIFVTLKFCENPLDPRLAKFSRILFFAIYIHTKLASVSAESLQNLRTRETTWLRLTCEIRASDAITFNQTREERENLVWSTEEG